MAIRPRNIWEAKIQFVATNELKELADCFVESVVTEDPRLKKADVFDFVIRAGIASYDKINRQVEDMQVGKHL